MVETDGYTNLEDKHLLLNRKQTPLIATIYSY